MTDEAAMDRQPDSVLLDAIMGSGRQLGYELRIQQQEVVLNFVKGRDVFVSLPTGSGKSLYFHGPTIGLDAAQNQARSSLL